MNPRISLVARQIAERRRGALRMLGSNGGSESRDDKLAALEIAETVKLQEELDRKRRRGDV